MQGSAGVSSSLTSCVYRDMRSTSRLAFFFRQGNQNRCCCVDARKEQCFFNSGSTCPLGDAYTQTCSFTADVTWEITVGVVSGLLFVIIAWLICCIKFKRGRCCCCKSASANLKTYEYKETKKEKREREKREERQAARRKDQKANSSAMREKCAFVVFVS